MKSRFETLISKLSSNEGSFVSNFDELEATSSDQKLLHILKNNPHLQKMLLEDEALMKSIHQYYVEKQESSLETPEKKIKDINFIPTSQKKTLGDSGQMITPESYQKGIIKDQILSQNQTSGSKKTNDLSDKVDPLMHWKIYLPSE